MDDKLDQILTIVSNLQTEVANLHTDFQNFQIEVRERFEKIEKRLDNLEKRLDNLEKRQDKLERHAGRVDKLFDLLETHVVAIGLELKTEFQKGLRGVSAELDRLRVEVYQGRADGFENRAKIADLEVRLEKIEQHLATV